MAKRLSDVVGTQVETGIEALEIPQMIKDSILWDVTPALAPDGRGFKMVYMVALTLPIPGSEDYVMEAEPLMDVPAPQDLVTTHVRVLYDRCQARADDIQLAAKVPQNGTRMSPGGIALP